jgi:glycosyltransferase involved in cell wall biosynthesis
MPCELSIVSPVYCSGELVPPLVARIVAAAQTAAQSFEIILVDDGSPDQAWVRIAAAAAADPRVRGVRLTRNFGQQNAITAGIAHAQGSHIVVLDADLQDNPAYIPELLGRAREGYDVVLTRKATREYGIIRNFITLVFYRVFNLLADIQAGDGHIGGYSLITRRVGDAYLGIADYQRDYLLLIRWMGFRTSVIEVIHEARPRGRSSYTPLRLARYAFHSITSHSTVLLRLAVAVGFLYFVASVAGIIYLIGSYFFHDYRAGWASTIVILLASTGIILMAIGVLGIYIGNVFDQVRGRPLYLVAETVNPPPPNQPHRAPPA